MDGRRLVGCTVRSLADVKPGRIVICVISILALARLVLAAPPERETNLQKAIDELHAGQALLAVADTSKAVEANPRSAEALAVLGLSQLKCGEWEKAESRFNEAAAIDSLSPEAHLGLGEIACARMRYREGIAHLRRATSSRLFPGAAYLALASSLEEHNLHREARQAMQEALKYTGELSPMQQAGLGVAIDILPAYEGRSLLNVSESFRSTSVHFEFSQNHIVLPVVLNGSKQADFVLDTGYGGALMISGDCAKGLDLKYLGDMAAKSLYGGLRLKAAILDSIRISGLVMTDVPVYVNEDYSFQASGLIGSKLVRKVNTTIDFGTMQIQFSNEDNPEIISKRITRDKAECVPFIFLTSMYIIARFGDDIPKAFIFDTGAVASYLHSSKAMGPDGEETPTPCSIRIGDLAFDLPQTRFLNFSNIHATGRYYFASVVGTDVMLHNILHILPRESMLCLEKGEPRAH